AVRQHLAVLRARHVLFRIVLGLGARLLDVRQGAGGGQGGGVGGRLQLRAHGRLLAEIDGEGGEAQDHRQGQPDDGEHAAAHVASFVARETPDRGWHGHSINMWNSALSWPPMPKPTRSSRAACRIGTVMVTLTSWSGGLGSAATAANGADQSASSPRACASAS